MNRICHITSAHKRYDVRIFEKECTSLAKNGFQTFLIVNDDLDNEVRNDVNIVSTKFKPSSRKERMFGSMEYVLNKAIEIDADIYHLHDPELMTLVKKLKKRGKKIIFDAHEDTEVQIMDKEWIPFFLRKIISKIYAIYAKKILAKCDAIITVTPAIVKKLKKYNSCVEMITNYPIVKEFEDMQIANSEGNYIFFAGGVCKQWCHERIAKAIEEIDGIEYVIAGPVETEYKKQFESVMREGKVEFLGVIPYSQVKSYYKNAIAGMAINECSQIKGEGTLGNTKLFEIMTAGIPVIASDYKLWREVVEDNNCGICVDSSDAEAIKNAIEFIISNEEKAKIMGENGKKAVITKYNWLNEEKKLVNLYEELI